ncbi:TetR/AcrR family transcriptional regulator [Solidesulfovibrio sp.]
MDVSRQMLVDAALKRFAAAGRDAVGTQDLVRRLGVAPELVFRHFKNRDELFAAVLARVQDALFAHIESSCPVVPGESGLSMILRLAEAYCRFLETSPRAYVDILRSSTGPRSKYPGPGTLELERLAARVVKQFEVLLLLGGLDGSVRPDVKADTARRIVSVVVGTVLLPLPPARARADSLRAVLRHLAGAPAGVRAA